jgi:integrase
MRQERPDFALNTVLPKNIRPTLYIPSDEEVKHLIKCVAGTDLDLPILLAAFGPMRRGEICTLRSDNIKGNVVHVKENMVMTPSRVWEIKTPKSAAGDRFIEYPDFVAKKWAGIDGRITDLNPGMITNRFHRLLKREGMNNFRFHDLRHYCASIQHAIGVPDAYIMERGGWGNDGVLKNVYRHALKEKSDQMSNKTNAYFTSMSHEIQHE